MRYTDKRRPVAVQFSDDDVTVVFDDGSKVSNPLVWHPWLAQAAPEQRANYELYPTSIDWPELDEGLDIEGMLRGVDPRYVNRGRRTPVSPEAITWAMNRLRELGLIQGQGDDE